MQTTRELETMQRENAPGHHSIIQRQSASARHAEVLEAFHTLYPDYRIMGVVLKMKSGTVLRIGWETALATLLRGDAELVVPPAVAGTKRLKASTARTDAPQRGRMVEV